MQSTDFYQNHLNGVSRSFSFCIARLRAPLRTWVSLSYLLCRVLDTVEDVIWTDSLAKKQAFLEFEKFLTELPKREEVNAWGASVPACALPAERVLLQDFYFLLADFHELPQGVREKMRRSVLNMSRGMNYFSSRSVGGVLRLRDLREVNQYCFFVAGLVGELLTDLLAAYAPSSVLSSGMYLKAHHFGLFLQKINLLKDQRSDELEGRFLVPQRQELLASLGVDARGAVDYLVSIPREQKEYRLFCAWSLFLGLASLPFIQRSWMAGIFGKIPRMFTEKLLHSVEMVIDDNQALLRLFQEQLPELPQLSRNLASGVPGLVDFSWFDSIYEGSMSPAHRRALGLA